MICWRTTHNLSNFLVNLRLALCLAFIGLILAISTASVVFADQRKYVTDRLLLNLRSGPSTSHRILRALKSGTSVEVISDTPEENGHVFVRTSQGSEGWVLNQYLQINPIARTQLKRLEQENASLLGKINQLNATLNSTKKSLDHHSTSRNELSETLATKEQELREIKLISKDAIALDRQNKNLSRQYQSLLLEVDKLRAENDRLNGNEQRQQWITGGGLVGFGAFLAWLIIGFSSHRKSGWL